MVKTWRNQRGIIVGKGKYYSPNGEVFEEIPCYIIKLNKPFQVKNSKSGFISHNYLETVVEPCDCVEIIQC